VPELPGMNMEKAWMTFWFFLGMFCGSVLPVAINWMVRPRAKLRRQGG